LYALVAALLISACVSVSLAGEATYDSMMLQSLSTSAAETPGSEGNETFLLDEWKREIIIDAWGGISGSDYYLIFNNQSEDLYRITFWLPVNASGISVQDAYGEYPKTSIVTSIWEDHIELTVMLRAPLRTGERNEFLISYRLPPDLYIIQNSWQDYTLKLNLSKPENWFVKKFKISILLPEGAVIKSVSNEPYKVEKQGLSIKITMEEIDLEDFLHPQISLEYQYFIIWGAARPAIWAAIASLVGAAFFYIWRFFRPEAAVTPLPVSTLRGFVEAYEEKRRLLGKIESLERQFRRGRVSRKRFRLRRRSLEQRLSSLNRRLVELRGQIAAASRRYEEMMREIETAEAEIETLNVDIEHVETRYRRGEISADVHRRLLAEYSRIKERAENRISEILLRLEEGI
jgi:hypothetical protein